MCNGIESMIIEPVLIDDKFPSGLRKPRKVVCQIINENKTPGAGGMRFQVPEK